MTRIRKRKLGLSRIFLFFLLSFVSSHFMSSHLCLLICVFLSEVEGSQRLAILFVELLCGPSTSLRRTKLVNNTNLIIYLLISHSVCGATLRSFDFAQEDKACG